MKDWDGETVNDWDTETGKTEAVRQWVSVTGMDCGRGVTSQPLHWQLVFVRLLFYLNPLLSLRLSETLWVGPGSAMLQAWEVKVSMFSIPSWQRLTSCPGTQPSVFKQRVGGDTDCRCWQVSVWHGSGGAERAELVRDRKQEKCSGRLGTVTGKWVVEVGLWQSEPSVRWPTLLHQGADAKPEAVEEGEVVLHYVRAGVAGVGIVPLVGAEPWREDRESLRISRDRSNVLCSVSTVTQKKQWEMKHFLQLLQFYARFDFFFFLNVVVFDLSPVGALVM